MPWNLRLVVEGVRPAVGDCWLSPGLLTNTRPHLLRYWISVNYRRDHASRRAPIIVRLPHGVSWCVDGPELVRGEPAGNGWIVTGDPPHLTVTPEITVRGWIGWIRGGVLGP